MFRALIHDTLLCISGLPLPSSYSDLSCATKLKLHSDNRGCTLSILHKDNTLLPQHTFHCNTPAFLHPYSTVLAQDSNFPHNTDTFSNSSVHIPHCPHRRNTNHISLRHVHDCPCNTLLGHFGSPNEHTTLSPLSSQAAHSNVTPHSHTFP